MNSLPPLRTVRDATSSEATASTPTQLATPPPRPAPPGLDIAGLSRPARDFLSELVWLGILDGTAVTEFVGRLGPRMAQLTTRERTADALVGSGFLTPYQATRAATGQSHGLVLGGYRVLDRLAGGSVGVVFRAIHPVLQRPAAVKVMAADESVRPELVERFVAECRMLAGLSHPNVVTAYDAGVVPPGGPGLTALYYLALELVPGGDLELYVVDRGPQPVGLACEWMRQAACGLRAAHGVGLVHRDIKPSNLLLTESRRVKLIDFGLARDFSSSLTGPRVLIGSVEFMPPEQLADPTTAGPAADVYGLGATLFWILTGHLPYPKIRNLTAALTALKTTPPRRLREVAPEMPEELDEFVARMLARNPAERPGVAEVIAGLARFAVPSSHPSQGKAPLIFEEDGRTGELLAAITQLENAVTAAERQAEGARDALLTTLAALTATRPGGSPDRHKRLLRTARVLAAALASHPDWPMLADLQTVRDWSRAILAHDLDPAQAVAVLEALTREHSPALPFLRVLRDVLRHHRERWDGTGSPDRLAGTAIPAAARFAAGLLAYDGVRWGEPVISHNEAMKPLDPLSAVAFDPSVIEGLRNSGPELDEIYGRDPPTPTGTKSRLRSWLG
jgi:hypothetical protein